MTQNTVYVIIRSVWGDQIPMYAYRTKERANDALDRLVSGPHLIGAYYVRELWVED